MSVKSALLVTTKKAVYVSTLMEALNVLVHQATHSAMNHINAHVC